MKKSLIPAALIAAFATPLLAFAQAGININAIGKYSNGIIDVINKILVPVLMAVAFIVFLYGIYKYFIYGAENETEKAEGRWFAFWGIVGFVIIVSLWGLVNLFQNVLGLSATTAPEYPQIGNGTGVTTGGVGTGNGTGNGGGVTGVGTFGSGNTGGTGATCANPSVYCPNGSVVCTVSQCTSGSTGGNTGGSSGTCANPSVYCPDGRVVCTTAQCSSVGGSATCSNPSVYCPDGRTVCTVAQCSQTGGSLGNTDGTSLQVCENNCNGSCVQQDSGGYVCQTSTDPTAGKNVYCPDGRIVSSVDQCGTSGGGGGTTTYYTCSDGTQVSDRSMCDNSTCGTDGGPC